MNEEEMKDVRKKICGIYMRREAFLREGKPTEKEKEIKMNEEEMKDVRKKICGIYMRREAFLREGKPTEKDLEIFGIRRSQKNSAGFRSFYQDDVKPVYDGNTPYFIPKESLDIQEIKFDELYKTVKFDELYKTVKSDEDKHAVLGVRVKDPRVMARIRNCLLAELIDDDFDL